MRVVEGELKMLGESRTYGNGQFRNYSNVEIGDQLLRNINTHTALAGFLERGLDMDGKTKLFITGKGIIAVELPNGKRYYIRSTFGLIRGIIVMISGVILLPFFLIGLIPLWNGFNMAREWKASIEVYTPTAIAVN